MQLEILAFNSQYQIIGKVNLERAITLLYFGKAYSVADSDKVVRSPSVSIKVPKAIVIPNAKYIKHDKIPFTKKNVLRRDGKACVYCGSILQLTIDHVIPKSRWMEEKKKQNLQYGLDSFQNCVAACHNCNTKKSNKLLKELGWSNIKPEIPMARIEVDWEILFNDKELLDIY